jgi:hypothetical protein
MSAKVIQQALVPMVVFFIVIMVVLAVGLRTSRRQAGISPNARSREAATSLWPHGLRPLAARGPGWLRVVTQYAYTAVGGYLLLMLVVVIYYFGVARVGGNFIESAFTGCGMLIGLSAPVFLVVSWLVKRRS